MSVEFDVQSASSAGVFGFESFEEKEDSKATHFNKSIFAPPFYPVQFSNKSALHYQTRESQKADTTVLSRLNGHKSAITEGNRAGGSSRKDSDGSSRTEVHYDHYERDDNGNSTSLGVSLSTERDSQGNEKHSAEVHGEIEF